MTTDGVRLGDLLTGAGLLQASDLREAMMISKQQGLPVGRVLIMSGYLTEQNLQAAVQAQSLLKDGLIDFPLVIKALTMVGAEDITLEEAFKRLKWNQQSDAVTNKLGELLLAAEIVPIDSLNAALLQCQSINLPLGRVLIANGVLTEQMLAATLNAQVFIRDKKLSRDQAIQGLKSAKERQIPIEQYLAESGAMQLPTAETVRLGELFVMAGIIDEPNLMGAVEVGLLNEQPLGQVLLNSSMITQEVLDAALDLQGMVGAGAIKKDEAAKYLGIVRTKKVSVGEAIALGQKKSTSKKQAAAAVEEPKISIEPLPLYQFLQLSGLITAKQIEQAIRVGSKDNQIMAKMLAISGVMEQPLIEAAQQCNDLIVSGVLNPEQGMIVLRSCERNQFTLEQAFNELGWNTAPLRANPDVPEALLDLPMAQPKHFEHVTETTKQMTELGQPVPSGTVSATEPTNTSKTVEEAPAAPATYAPPAAATETSDILTPVATTSQATATGDFPAYTAPTAAEISSNQPGQPSTPSDAPPAWATETSRPAEPPAPSLFGATTNPFEPAPNQPPEQAPKPMFFSAPTDFTKQAQPNAPHEPETLAELGAALAAADEPAQAAPVSSTAPAEQEPFKTPEEAAWHSAPADEWMPTAASTPEPAPAADPWQAGGQAQQSDGWQGGQASRAAETPAWSQPQQAPAQQQPAAQADWAGSSSSALPPVAQPDWASSSSTSMPAVQAQPPSQADWAAAPQTSAQPQPAAQSDWAATPATPQAPQADWTGGQASQPAAQADWATPAAPQAPAQADWAGGQASQPAAQADWANTPAVPQAPTQADWAGNAAQLAQATQGDWSAGGQPQPTAQAAEWAGTPAQPPGASEWAAPGVPGAPAQASASPTQGDWGQTPPGADWGTSNAPTAQTDWASPAASQPAAQADWAPAPATSQPAQTEWQPPTSSAPQEAWQPPEPAPVVPEQPAQAPAQPPAQGQPSWQSAAPSPLPGWQSSSATNLDAWQSLPTNSPAAQMFQEAAQSLAGTPETQPTQAPAPAPEQASQIDLFSGDEEDHTDQSDKPKKRLSDLMPKFGQKS